MEKKKELSEIEINRKKVIKYRYYVLFIILDILLAFYLIYSIFVLFS